MTATDKVFSGSIPALYETHMVPLLFAPYAAEMARRVAAHAPGHVLEIAAGTGAVTAELLQQLPRDATITATDLNQGMLDVASEKLTDRRIRLRLADAQDLPFQDASFDAVVCQFGAMFFPDKPLAFREARRVLDKGGTYFLSVWDDLASNPFAAVVQEAVANEFPADPPGFFGRTPYGHHDIDALTAALGEAGFKKVAAERVTFPCRGPSAEEVAMALCQGTPLRSEIEQRAPEGLAAVTAAATRALREAYGSGPIESTQRAILFEAEI